MKEYKQRATIGRDDRRTKEILEQNQQAKLRRIEEDRKAEEVRKLIEKLTEM